MELVLIACAGIGGLALAAAEVLPERVERIAAGRSSNAAIPANARGLQTLLSTLVERRLPNQKAEESSS